MFDFSDTKSQSREDSQKLRNLNLAEVTGSEESTLDSKHKPLCEPSVVATLRQTTEPKTKTRKISHGTQRRDFDNCGG